MSRLINFENNSIIEITVKTINQDHNKTRHTISVGLDSPDLQIQSKESLELNDYDVKNIVAFLKESICEEFFCAGNSISYADSNAMFEITVTSSPYDEMFSIDFWLNIATVSMGRKYGYDYGIRFATQKKDYLEFAKRLITECSS